MKDLDIGRANFLFMQFMMLQEAADFANKNVSRRPLLYN